MDVGGGRNLRGGSGERSAEPLAVSGLARLRSRHAGLCAPHRADPAAGSVRAGLGQPRGRRGLLPRDGDLDGDRQWRGRFAGGARVSVWRLPDLLGHVGDRFVARNHVDHPTAGGVVEPATAHRGAARQLARVAAAGRQSRRGHRRHRGLVRSLCARPWPGRVAGALRDHGLDSVRGLANGPARGDPAAVRGGLRHRFADRGGTRRFRPVHLQRQQRAVRVTARVRAAGGHGAAGRRRAECTSWSGPPAVKARP